MNSFPREKRGSKRTYTGLNAGSIIAPKKKKGKGKTSKKMKLNQQQETTTGPTGPSNPAMPIHRPMSEEEVEGKRMGFHISVPGICLINGKPGSGKSHLLRYIFYINKEKFRLGLAVSGTLHDPQNLDYVPESFKMHRYDPGRVQELIQRQMSVPKEIRQPAYFIADDYISDKKMWEDPGFQDMCTRCRHLEILVVVNTQYINKVPPIFRESAFQSALFHLDTKRSVDAAYDSYGNGFDTVQDFKMWNKGQLGKHEFLFVDKYNIEDDDHKVFKAPEDIPPFKLWDPEAAMEAKKQIKKKKKKNKNKY